MKFPFKEAKQIDKPWGNELWIANGISTPYALKRILFRNGTRSSLQVHQFKFETNYVLSGNGSFLICENIFDCTTYLESNNRFEMVESALKDAIIVEIEPGCVIDVKPGQIHRVMAESDLVFIEASTVELDDVIRLADDANRGHGRIATEHTS